MTRRPNRKRPACEAGRSEDRSYGQSRCPIMYRSSPREATPADFPILARHFGLGELAVRL